MKQIQIKEKNGLPSINNIICTFATKEIRTEIEGIFEVNNTFNLPKKYTYQVMPSDFWGKVAKIVEVEMLNKISNVDNVVVIHINGSGYIKEMMKDIILNKITDFEGEYHLFVDGEKV